jgi:uncharacterized protein with FMN-binding domain
MMKRFARPIALVGCATVALCATIDSSAEAFAGPLFWTAIGHHNEAPALPADGTPAVELAANARRYTNGSFTGPAVDAYYGLVQVQVTIQGGRLASVEVLQYPSDRRTSRVINAQALPILESEVISAQSARVDIVSGATLTSHAYLRSINAALHQAGG